MLCPSPVFLCLIPWGETRPVRPDSVLPLGNTIIHTNILIITLKLHIDHILNHE